MTELRTWTQYATDTGAGDPYRFADVQNKRWMAEEYACGRGPVVEVEVHEDPNGTYLGWIAAGEDYPCLIQPNDLLFRVQFTYSVQDAVDSGKGVVVPLSVRLPAAD